MDWSSLCSFCTTNNDSYLIVLVWQWSPCTVEEISVDNPSLCQKRINVVASWEKLRFFLRMRSGFVFFRTEGKRERSVWHFWASLPCCFSPSQLLLYFFLVTDDVFGAGDQNSSTVCLLYTHTHAVTLPSFALFLCKFHQWVKSLVYCACVHSGSLNISSHVRSTRGTRDEQRKN